MQANFDPVIMEHVSRIQNKDTHVHYLSNRVQDELITTPGIEHKEILLRIVHMDEENENSTPTIQEYFLDFVTVDSSTGLNLSDVLITQLKLYKINTENCRGQAYDNGSNMPGRYQGVQNRILNINPRAFFTPCGAHNLNLVLCDSAKKSTIAITFFETRWESRKNSVKALSFQLSSILDTLEEVSYTANDLMAKSEAVSQSNEIGNYEFILSLVIWYDILTEVNIVSKSVQDHNMDINTSVKMVQSLLQFLHQYRENEFNLAKSAPNKLAKNADITVAFKNPRVRKKKKLFEYENVDEPMLNNEDRFRTNYFFIILDNANSRLRNALNSWRLIRTILDFCIELANNDLKDVDGFDLFSELIIFRSLVDEDTNSLQALNILKTSNGLFPNLTIALRIMLTIPVTSACAERMFSKLKLIKTYLRNQLG
ncbi:zinc finger MYM-type protein 1-like [Rhopalosiphum maidis]|uniref:zinc finger MYM-type protein 1-like n=1 Tax=Rhopalosiphum maidis TaxID=43146 RepID=UPI000F0062B9|nr:zinc finger MYM-type protein 1-like [Rhopalosiphum maidis]